MPHPKIQGDPNGAPSGPVGRGGHYGAMFTAVYDEGAAVGYKWFFKQAEQPLFPFGFGLSYTSFDLSQLAVNARGHTVTASATVGIRARGPASRRRNFISLDRMARTFCSALSGGTASTSSQANSGK